VSAPGTAAWFAHHEFRLAWRDWLSMMTAGRRRRARTVILALAALGVAMHALAFSMLAQFSPDGGLDKTVLITITGSALLSWSLMLSQAMESVTRAFYARSDLDLILSSPAAVRRLFSVRIAIVAISVAVMAMLLAAPFIDVLMWRDGAHWFAAYGVVAAMGAAAAALAVALTVALFRTIGPRRTRFVAQVVAAVIGAAFVIGIQAAAILSYGTLSRLAVLQSQALAEVTPDVGSILWWPARAMLGETAPLAAVLALGMLLLGAAIAFFAPRFGEHALAAAGVTHGTILQRRAAAFRTASPARTLRRKEWTLLLRDPWLASQTLMQLLYLLPPALMLWRTFSDGGAGPVLVVPVLVMAAGQLAGGLAWLAISGEDAPDLVATAPLSPGRVIRAKVEAVLGGTAVIFAPFVLALAFASPFAALIAAGGIVCASAGAMAIQLWFRAQAKRSHFRRRQTSSRIATFAEAFSSITWAATAALAAAGTWLALFSGLTAIAVLACARLVAPRQ